MTISGFVAYVKQLWRNFPDASTPVTAERLTHMESGIKGNSDAIEKLAAAVVNQIVNDSNKIAGMAALYSVNQKVTELNSNKIDKSAFQVKNVEVTVSDANTQTKITEMEGLGNKWIPVVVGHGSKIHSMATVSFDGYDWYISATVVQMYRIVFYKYPG